MSEREFDLICMGRAAVDLYSDQIGTPLEDANTFSKYLGGCAGNIAVGTSRLGLRTAMLTRVGKEAMGVFVRKTLDEEGVDISMVVEDSDHLTALVLLGINPPDNFPLIFYRENCADAEIDEKDFSEETFKRTHSLLVTGTHFSTEKMSRVSIKAVKEAKSVGCKVILDVDFRPVLWGLTGHCDGDSRYVKGAIVHERLKSILPLCDLIVGTEEELKVLTNKEETQESIQTLLAMNSSLTIVEKKGKMGCEAYSSDLIESVVGGLFKVKVLNVLGAGDAFMSAFLRGWLRQESLLTCCTWGNASGALVVMRHGCSAAIPFWPELQLFVEKKGITNLKELERQHDFFCKKNKKYEKLCVMAFDHRDYFMQYTSSLEDVIRLKKMLYEVAKRINCCENLGILLDEEFSSEIINDVDTEIFWVACAIEKPGSFPLEFIEGREAAQILRHRSKDHVVKVLLNHPLEASSTDLNLQKKKLQQLYWASLEWKQQLLVEIIVEGDLSRVPYIIEEYYQFGIKPAWWKLQPNNSEKTWNKIELLLQEYDPLCQGVLVLGLNATLDALESKMKTLQSHNVIKGFAVGRSIWGKAAQDWLQKELSDEEFINIVTSKFYQLIDMWTCKTAGV